MNKKELIDLIEEVKVLKLTPKDILVVKVPLYISPNDYKKVRDIFCKAHKTLSLPAENLIITTLDLEMEVVQKDENSIRKN